MKVVVCVRATAWTEDEIRFTPDSRAVDAGQLAFELGEEDRCAVAAALELVAGEGGEVVVVSVGDENAAAPLRVGLAMGAGRAIRVDGEPLLDDPLRVAALLASVVADEQPQLVLCGAQSSDETHGATGGALAGLLDWPCAAVAARLSVGDGRATVCRALEGGVTDVVDVELPAVVTLQTGSSAPRHPTLRALKQADDAALDVRPSTPRPPSSRVRRMYRPSRENTAQMLDGELADVAATIAGLIAGRVS